METHSPGNRHTRPEYAHFPAQRSKPRFPATLKLQLPGVPQNSQLSTAMPVGLVTHDPVQRQSHISQWALLCPLRPDLSASSWSLCHPWPGCALPSPKLIQSRVSHPPPPSGKCGRNRASLPWVLAAHTEAPQTSIHGARHLGPPQNTAVQRPQEAPLCRSICKDSSECEDSLPLG